MAKNKPASSDEVQIDSQRSYLFGHVRTSKVLVQCTECHTKYYVDVLKEFPLPEHINSLHKVFDGNSNIIQRVYHCPNHCKVATESGVTEDAPIQIYKTAKEKIAEHQQKQQDKEQEQKQKGKRSK